MQSRVRTSKMLKIENLFRFRRNIPITRSKTEGLTEVRQGERESKVAKTEEGSGDSVVGVDQLKSDSVNQSAECLVGVVVEELPEVEGTAEIVVTSSSSERTGEEGEECRQGRLTDQKLHIKAHRCKAIPGVRPIVAWPQ